MARCMVHRPGSVTGTHHQDDLRISVGWVAHSGTLGAIMPLWNSTRDVCLVITGELFPSDELPSLLAGANGEHPLFSLYQRQGASFVSGLNGWFSGLLLDLRSKQVFLFNDRYGMARLYVYDTDDAFYFASEAKCLLKVLPNLRALDPRGLAEWWSCGCVLEGRTLFPRVTLLPPAALWLFGPDGSIHRARYFQPREWEEQNTLDPEAYYTGLKQCFARILPRYFESPKTIGISLTGGVDSRLIMAWRPQNGQRIPCYSFGGPFRECQDVKLGRQIAAACGDPHHVIRVDRQFLGEFPALAAQSAFISDGTMDASGAVELFVNQRARDIAPVRLTGSYGGEVLRSTIAFWPRALSPLPFAPELRPGFSQVAETFHAQLGGHPLSFIAFKQVPWHHHARFSIEQSQLTIRSPYLENDLVKYVFRAPRSARTGKDVSLRLIREGRPALRGIPTDRGLRNGSHSPIDALRQKVIAFTVKAEYAYDYGMPQWFVRIDRLLGPLHLERVFLGRHKFYHFRHWYRYEFASYLRDVLLSDRTLSRSHFESAGLTGLVEAHLAGRSNHTLELSRLLALELMQRQLIDSPALGAQVA